MVKRTEVEPFDRIAGIEWNAVEFGRNVFVAETSSKKLKTFVQEAKML